MYKSFQHGSRKLDVLRGVNLRLDAGEMVTIIGASGAGKSTLLHCLGTLDLPTSGEILFYPPNSSTNPGTPTDIKWWTGWSGATTTAALRALPTAG